MITLEGLPDSILELVIDLLPQQAKFNLCLVNYKFYQVVQPELYENLIFTISSIIPSKSDFRSSLATIIGGSSNPLVSTESQRKLYNVRQEVLLQSLSINEQLAKFIKRVIVYTGKEEGVFSSNSINDKNDDDNAAFPAANLKLLDLIKKRSVNLVQFTVIGDTSRGIAGLTKEQILLLPRLERLDITDLTYLDCLTDSIKTLVIHKLTTNRFDLKTSKPDIINQIGRLDSLIINDEDAQVRFLQYLIGDNPKLTFKFKALRLLHYHGFSDYNVISTRLALQLLNYVDRETLKSLELVMGCDHITCDCLKELVNNITVKKDFDLTRMAIQQFTVHKDHNYSEKFDFYVSDLLSKMKHRSSIRYLCISYDTPNDFNIGNGIKGNGIEGNWLKRKRLFAATLPKLTGLKTLVLPHFLENAAGYEQIISDLLWNGCKCSHCKDYLSLFDYYIMHHQYYNSLDGYMTDMISPILFGSAGRVMASRVIEDFNLNALKYPPLDTYWNFHKGNGISHFKSQDKNDCKFNESCFKPLTKCISHFFLEYVESYGSSLPSLNLVVMNGEYFDRVEGKSSEWICEYA
ncbi:hypothetical protein FOA43_000396 [Brettanomyces nanus]|uniref:F-box domain-containing protein n=1 Tax=Eeniella nana TaxID=13502 RepID=A0A875RVR1_EENNA|nr:uncharacterized protein FOA43_000396 [Brettanomyces nanus]QPG73091.1 hypothetical protein FOA43_000396 [Brettanomyces nanus]